MLFIFLLVLVYCSTCVILVGVACELAIIHDVLELFVHVSCFVSMSS